MGHQWGHQWGANRDRNEQTRRTTKRGSSSWGPLAIGGLQRASHAWWRNCWQLAAQAQPAQAMVQLHLWMVTRILCNARHHYNLGLYSEYSCFASILSTTATQRLNAKPIGIR